MRTLVLALALVLPPIQISDATLFVDASPTGTAPGEPFTATCSVSAGQNLGDALLEAVTTGCLASVSLPDTQFGRYLDCVNGVCGWFDGDASRFWILYENGLSASVGVDALEVDEGDVFHASYDNCIPTLLWTCVPNWAVP